MAFVDAGSERAHLGRVTEVTHPTPTVQMEQEQIPGRPFAPFARSRPVCPLLLLSRSWMAFWWMVFWLFSFAGNGNGGYERKCAAGVFSACGVSELACQPCRSTCQGLLSFLA